MRCLELLPTALAKGVGWMGGEEFVDLSRLCFPAVFFKSLEHSIWCNYRYPNKEILSLNVDGLDLKYRVLQFKILSNQPKDKKGGVLFKIFDILFLPFICSALYMYKSVWPWWLQNSQPLIAQWLWWNLYWIKCSGFLITVWHTVP